MLLSRSDRQQVPSPRSPNRRIRQAELPWSRHYFRELASQEGSDMIFRKALFCQGVISIEGLSYAVDCRFSVLSSPTSSSLQVSKGYQKADLLFASIQEQRVWLKLIAHYAVQADFKTKYKKIGEVNKSENCQTVKVRPRSSKDHHVFFAKFYNKSKVDIDSQVVREAEVLWFAKCQSNLATLREIYEQPGNFILLFDFVDGPSLWNFMQPESPRLSENDLRTVLKGVLEGLAYLHQGGFCHRNVKPEHILVRKSQFDSTEAVLINFRQARKENQTQTGLEQSEGQQQDVYDLGIAFQKIVMGHFPDEANEGSFHSAYFGKKENGLNNRHLMFQKVLEGLLSFMTLEFNNQRLSASQCLLSSYFNKNFVTISIQEPRSPNPNSGADSDAHPGQFQDLKDSRGIYKLHSRFKNDT